MNNAFSEGDLIEATQGDTVIRGRVVEVGAAGDRVRIKGIDTYFPNSALGFTVEVLEKAAPALPTEPGVYVGSFWPDLPMWLTDEGQWITAKARVRAPERHAPFTRMEPEAVTAKRVLDRFDAVFGASFISPLDVLKQLREEFGVTK